MVCVWCVLTELVRAGEVTQRRDVRGPPGTDQTVGKCRQSLDQSENSRDEDRKGRPTRRCHSVRWIQWIHFNHTTTPASVVSDVPSVPTQAVCCFRWDRLTNVTSTVYCGGLLMGEDVQKHLGLTRMSSGWRPAVTLRGSDDLDTVELQLEHQRSDLLTAAALQTVTCCWAESGFYSNAGYVKGFSFWA